MTHFCNLVSVIGSACIGKFIIVNITAVYMVHLLFAVCKIQINKLCPDSMKISEL